MFNYQNQNLPLSDNNRFRKYFSPTNRTPSHRYIKNYFCPFQRYVERRPNPYRPISKTDSRKNQFNFPIEKEKFISCYKHLDKKKLYPLITREDLTKFLKLDTTLFKHKKPCEPCDIINEGNYGRNYYSVIKKSFPFIQGNFCGNITKFTPRNSTTNIHSRNTTKKLRNKLIEKLPLDHYTEIRPQSVNRFKNIFNMTTPKNKMEEMKNERCNDFQILSRNNSHSYFFRNTKTGFHKTQIFNNLKPFLVDDYNAFLENN